MTLTAAAVHNRVTIIHRATRSEQRVHGQTLKHARDGYEELNVHKQLRARRSLAVVRCSALLRSLQFVDHPQLLANMAAIVDDVLSLISCQPPSILRPSALLVTFGIALPHFLYAFIWFRPEQWQKLFPKNAVDAFATAGAIGKRKSGCSTALQQCCALSNHASNQWRTVIHVPSCIMNP
jgi:hypothetical protein